MKQTIEDVKDRLKRRKEQYSRQEKRLEQLETVMKNAKEDIEQMEYTIRKLENACMSEDRRKIICNKDISSFFTHLCEVFDGLQHRYHIHLNYKLTCLIINSRYCFRSRTRAPGKQFLSEATVLTYFKYERNAVGKTISRSKI